MVDFDRKSFSLMLLARQKKTGERMIDIILDVFENEKIEIDLYNYKKFINQKIKAIIKGEACKSRMLSDPQRPC